MSTNIFVGISRILPGDITVTSAMADFLRHSEMFGTFGQFFHLFPNRFQRKTVPYVVTYDRPSSPTFGSMTSHPLRCSVIIWRYCIIKSLHRYEYGCASKRFIIVTKSSWCLSVICSMINVSNCSLFSQLELPTSLMNKN